MSAPFARFLKNVYSRVRSFQIQWRSNCLNYFRILNPVFFYAERRKHDVFYHYMRAFEVLPAATLLSKGIDTDVTPLDVEENITHLLALARIALEKGDIDRAEAILEMGLKISEDHSVYLGMPYMYDILTSIALAQGNVEKAERLLVNAVEKMIHIGMAEDNHHIVDFKLRLARIYSSFKDNDLAEIGFKTCLEAQKMKITNGDSSTRTGMLYVNILFWYGVHMIRNEHYGDAKQMLDKAYEYSIKIKGLSPYQEMVILYTLGDLNMELGQYDIALQNMLNAVLLGKGISSMDLPKCYAKLAKIYTKMGVYDQAKSSAMEAKKLATLFNHYDVLDEVSVILHEINLAEKEKKLLK
ncbi:hypothetical protein ILUMI_25811 [Ignelater luminosus]|uniref:MalT-like TPR region domain-containing protein n=1 Tax=Ignelater luminosus TaxID=2038154 RepID=A0A8K0FZQ0_IGNLU|nr:hypothetical protein ILUMI_25811 [Ignelater luminosus]